MRRGLTSLALVAASACSATQVHYEPMAGAPERLGALDAVVYLVGDAGDSTPGRDAVFGHLGADLGRLGRERPGTPAAVLFLGDNIYEVGARADARREDLEKLAAQVRVLDSMPGADGYFLPGNHDWAAGAADRLARESIRRQQAWLAELSPDTSARLLPGDGCPGPAPVAMGGNVHLVLIDTEWLLRLPDDDCGGEAGFYARLSSMLGGLRGQRVLLAAHHPLATGGPHGGNVSPLEWGPLVYYLGVKSGLGVQDLASGRYAHMLARLRDAIEASGTEPVAFAAGHDHTLQVIRMTGPDTPRYQLVSGSAARRSPTGRVDGTRYASGAHGYMRLDFAADRTRVVVFAQDESSSSLRAVFACTLGSAGGRERCPEAPLAGGGR